VTNKYTEIPQNNNNNYLFVKNNYMNSIDILLYPNVDTNLENLFLIFKSYLNIKDKLKAIYVIGENCNYLSEIYKKTNILHNINIKKMEKINLIDFENWYDDLINEDYKYIQNYKYYGFSFVFYNDSINWIENILYPHYPWNENFKDLYVKKYVLRNNALEEINKLKKKI